MKHYTVRIEEVCVYRQYGTVVVEANSPAEAIAKVEHGSEGVEYHHQGDNEVDLESEILLGRSVTQIEEQ